MRCKLAGIGKGMGRVKKPAHGYSEALKLKVGGCIG